MEPMFDGSAPLTTYEQASLSLQQASLDLQQAGLGLQQASVDAALSGNEIALWVGVGQAAVALTVGLIQAGVVGWGIWYMIRMSERREQQHADRHAETMEAFRLQTTASREQHEETLEALRQQGEALRQQGDALRTLIERTAPSHA